MPDPKTDLQVPESPEATSLTLSEPQFLTPAMDLDVVRQSYAKFVDFVNDILKEGTDYGAAGEGGKPSLLKPGAEKLIRWFALEPTIECIAHTIDFEAPFFYWWYRCRLWRGKKLVAEADGLCNSNESKYRYRWVPQHMLPLFGFTPDSKLFTRGGKISEFCWAVERAETSGQYGKPAEYWQRFRDAIADGTARRIEKAQRSGKIDLAWEIDATTYRVPNPDPADIANTVLKIAQKRAMVGATLIATNASEFFTQDMEDLDFGLEEQPAAPQARPVAQQPPPQPQPPAGQPQPVPQPPPPPPPPPQPPQQARSARVHTQTDVSLLDSLSEHDRSELYAHLRIAKGWNQAKADHFIANYTGTVKQLFSLAEEWRFDADEKRAAGGDQQERGR